MLAHSSFFGVKTHPFPPVPEYQFPFLSLKSLYLGMKSTLPCPPLLSPSKLHT